jgi:hypothetical protein
MPDNANYRECSQDGCDSEAVIWFRIRRPERHRLVVEFDLDLVTKPKGVIWQALCGPHLNGALVVTEDVVTGGVNSSAPKAPSLVAVFK